MKEIIVIKEYEGKLLWEFILYLYPDKTKTSIKKSINNGDVKINNLKVKDNYLLKNGDSIKVYFRSKEKTQKYLNCNVNCKIVYEDKNILVMDKPKGVLSQEDKSEKINTLNNFIKKYASLNGYSDNEANDFSLIHRLDQNTSGLIIGCKNKEVTRKMNVQMARGNIVKKYIAIVHGKPKQNKIILRDFIHKDLNQNKMIVTSKKLEHSSEIITEVKLIHYFNNMSIVEVCIHSGKKHQIRSHLAFHNMPIVGDYKYQNKKYNSKIKSQILISNEIIFNLDDKDLNYLNDIKIKLIDLSNKEKINKFLQDVKLL